MQLIWVISCSAISRRINNDEVPTSWTVVTNVPVPHAIPITFVGDGSQGHAGYTTSPASGIAAGLGNAFLQDSLGRRRIRPQTTLPPDPDTMSNITNLTVVVPETQPISMPQKTVQVAGTNAPPAGRYLSGPGSSTNARGAQARARAAGGNAVMGPAGSHNTDTGIYRDAGGNTVYDPKDPNSGVPYGAGIGAPEGTSVDETGTFTTPLRRK